MRLKLYVAVPPVFTVPAGRLENCCGTIEGFEGGHGHCDTSKSGSVHGIVPLLKNVMETARVSPGSIVAGIVLPAQTASRGPCTFTVT